MSKRQKPLVAQTPGMKEFDPESEKHYPLLIVKVVDPGCTLELQLEDCVSGTVYRMTTTEDEVDDRKVFRRRLDEVFDLVWAKCVLGMRRE